MQAWRDGISPPRPRPRIEWAALAALFLFAAPICGDDWILLATDEIKRTYLNASAPSRNPGGEARFQVRLAFFKARDMMGLAYDGSTTQYSVSCESRVILSMQRFLLDGAEVVWTFPATSDLVQVDWEIPGDVLGRVCR